MANTPQARKRIRRNQRRHDINQARKSRIRSYIKNVDSAIAAGDSEGARQALKTAEPEIMRGVSKGVLHKNAAARTVSRLAKRIDAIEATR